MAHQAIWFRLVIIDPRGVYFSLRSHDRVEKDFGECCMALRHCVLSSGLSLVVQEMPRSMRVSTTVLIKGGASGEVPESGVAHFLEHVLFRSGSRFYPWKELTTMIEGHGAEMNANTSDEQIQYMIDGFPEDIELILDVLSDMTVQSCFRESEIDAERGPVLQEIARYHDNADSLAFKHYNKFIWGDHPLGNDILGSHESVSSLKQDDFVRYHELFFCPKNMIVSIAGNIKFEHARNLVDRYFVFSMKKTNSITPPPVSWSGKSALDRFRFQEYPSEQMHCILGCVPQPWITSYPSSRRDRIALKLLMGILGNGLSSRLFNRVRVDHGLAYEIASFPLVTAQASSYCVYWACNPSDAARALSLIQEELALMAIGGVTELELTKVKNQTRAVFAETNESSRATSDAMASAMSLGNQLMSFKKLFETAVAPITTEDLKVLAQRLLKPEFMKLFVLGKSGSHCNDLEWLMR